MAEDRQCGTCTLCCKVMGITELAKPEGVWCPRCAPGRGCKAYDDRPQSCRDFSCAWLTSEFIPDALKPDRVKVVFALDLGGTRLVAYPDPQTPLAWRRGPVLAFLRQQAARQGGGWHVVARLGEQMWLVTAAELYDLGQIPPGTAYSLADGAEGLRLTVQRPGAAQAVTVPLSPMPASAI